jgi:uncharacterized protein YktB (UPF0637 family)
MRMPTAAIDFRFEGLPRVVFEVFQIPDFDGRMAAIRREVTPRLEALGRLLAPDLSRLLEEPVYPHVAKHLRRRVNPPDDTWVAWGPSPRGYKATPHFEAGVSAAGVFARFVIKPEGQGLKPALLDAVSPATLEELQIPSGGLFWYRGDHGQDPLPVDTLAADWPMLRSRAAQAQNSIAVGEALPRDRAEQAGTALASWVLEAVGHAAPLYRLARKGAPQGFGA